MFLDRFSKVAILENFHNRFLRNYQKTRKLKVPINMDNDWMYRIYQDRGKGFITLGAMSLGRFSKN